MEENKRTVFGKGIHNPDIIGKIYKHLKTGNHYKVIELGTRESDLETLVIYKSLSSEHEEHTTWVRPYDEFMDGRFEEVEKPKEINRSKLILAEVFTSGQDFVGTERKVESEVISNDKDYINEFYKRMAVKYEAISTPTFDNGDKVDDVIFKIVSLRQDTSADPYSLIISLRTYASVLDKINTTYMNEANAVIEKFMIKRKELGE